MKIKSYNPANNEVLGQIETTSLTDIPKIVNNSKLDDKINIDSLLISNKSITFASDKGTFVLLTINKSPKELIKYKELGFKEIIFNDSTTKQLNDKIGNLL